MAWTYSACLKLTGAPVCGNNVTNMSNAYSYCRNLYGNSYFYSPNVSNMQNCFYNRNASNQLNIYVIKDSTTNTTIHTQNITGTSSAPIWTEDTANNCQYNTQYNIYIYPVDDVAAARVANGD
jgi:hypothetical protein